MADVINFKESLMRSHTGIAARGRERRLDLEANSIEEALVAVPILRSLRAREVAAGNLTRLLDEARDVAGVRRVDVARSVRGWEQDGAPQKRLDKLTLPRVNRLANGALTQF